MKYKIYCKPTNNLIFLGQTQPKSAENYIVVKTDNAESEIIYNGSDETAALRAILKDSNINITSIKLDDSLIAQMLKESG